jgi:hypothetical protein
MLLFEFGNNPHSLVLHLRLGPGPKAIAKRLCDLAQRKDAIFHRSQTRKGDWNSLYRKTILSSSDYDEPDMEGIGKKIEQVLSQFMSDDFGQLVSAVQQEFRQK